MASIRAEDTEDAVRIRRVHELGFGQSEEADLVERLREGCPDLLSLVAEEDGAVVGHILFTPVTIDDRPEGGMGLGPMAVLPERQGRGIGSELVRHGLAMVESQGCRFVVVVGHPAYYPRFGFEPASRHGLRSQWADMPEDAFMVRPLGRPGLAGLSGVVRYRKEFDEAT